MWSNDVEKQADEKTSHEGIGISQDGKAYKLIKLNYDIVIVVDDSTSMQVGKPISRWKECREAISVIAEAALQFDSEGIDVHFLNSRRSGTCKTRAEVDSLFQSVHLTCGTPTGAKLEELLKDYWGQLKRSRRLFGPPVDPPKPVIYIVLTDGEPTDSPRDVIIKYAKKLHRASWPVHQVGIQFVQVGDSREAARSLRELDDNLKQKCKRDMVDYTLYDPNAVSGSPEDEHTIQAQLTKILVGAIDKDVDRKTAGDIYAKQGNRYGGSPSVPPPPSYQRATSPKHL
jgi:uncharacterized protein YegL